MCHFQVICWLTKNLTLKKSTYMSILLTSGAIQYGVPMKDLRLPRVAVIWADTPKSASLTSPRSVSKILAPLISRCILPIEWRYTRPCKVSRHIKAICFSDNGPVTAKKKEKKIRVDFTKIF